MQRVLELMNLERRQSSRRPRQLWRRRKRCLEWLLAAQQVRHCSGQILWSVCRAQTLRKLRHLLSVFCCCCGSLHSLIGAASRHEGILIEMRYAGKTASRLCLYTSLYKWTPHCKCVLPNIDNEASKPHVRRVFQNAIVYMDFKGASEESQAGHQCGHEDHGGDQNYSRPCRGEG